MHLTRLWTCIGILFFTGVLAITGIQTVKPWLPEVTLEGKVKVIPPPQFSWKNWFDGSFQTQAELWLDQHLGLRGWFIKTDNQINYWLFHEIHQQTDNRLIIGKENTLFEYSYIQDALGMHYVTNEVLEERVRRVRTLQDRLQERGIPFVFLISPSKATYFAERIPPQLIEKTVDRYLPPNYDRVVPLLKKYEVNTVDGRDFLLSRKSNSPHPLFSKSGTHWTAYGSCLITNEVLQAIWTQTTSSEREANCTNVHFSPVPKYDDRDLSDLTNLWRTEVFNQPLVYPKPVTSTPNTLRLLFIGDSFMWGILKNIREQRLAQTSDFYYYFQTHSLPDQSKQPVRKEPKELLQAITSKNAVIIEANEASLHDIGFGFVDAALRVLEAEK